MASITIRKEFKDRNDLENWVRGHCGVRSEKNVDNTLDLSEEEMKKLSLAESDTVFGVRVQKALPEVKEKP